MARITDWKSVDNLDNNLKEIKHYQLHPEMLPYIGKNYNYGKILLIGESHYVDTNYDIDSWYEKNAADCFKKKNADYKKYISWFTTRDVLLKFMMNIRHKSYSIFRNPANAIKEYLNNYKITDSEAFSLCTFYNYFQRPECNKGESIHFNENDCKVAANVLTQIIEKLEPVSIIFLSKTAYDAYMNQCEKFVLEQGYIDFVAHPTSPYYWHDEKKPSDKQIGKCKFINLLKPLHIDTKQLNEKQNIPYKDLTHEFSEFINTINALENTKLEHKFLKKNQQKFTPGFISTKILTNQSFFKEIQLYFYIENRKYSIGYHFEYEHIWIYQYGDQDTEAGYILDLNTFHKNFLNTLFVNFKRMIEKLN